MYTVFSNIVHAVPCTPAMPTLKDEIGGGALALRRRQTRALRRWQLAVPVDQPAAIDELVGLLEYVQGDTPFWWDGGGFGEVREPSIFGTGDPTRTDFILPHRFVFIASLVVYVNGSVFTNWIPLGGDGLSTCDAVRFGVALGQNNIATAKYRRMIKVVLDTENDFSQESILDDLSDATKSLYMTKYALQEVAN